MAVSQFPHIPSSLVWIARLYGWFLILVFFSQDGIKNGVLAVQTLWNNIMASTLLASTAITLSSLIDILVGSSGSGGAATAFIYGDDNRLGSYVKYFAILVCFLIAFLFNVQSIRYYSHVSFLINVPAGKPGKGTSSAM